MKVIKWKLIPKLTDKWVQTKTLPIGLHQEMAGDFPDYE